MSKLCTRIREKLLIWNNFVSFLGFWRMVSYRHQYLVYVNHIFTVRQLFDAFFLFIIFLVFTILVGHWRRFFYCLVQKLSLKTLNCNKTLNILLREYVLGFHQSMVYHVYFFPFSLFFPIFRLAATISWYISIYNWVQRRIWRQNLNQNNFFAIN